MPKSAPLPPETWADLQVIPGDLTRRKAACMGRHPCGRDLPAPTWADRQHAPDDAA